MKKYKNKYRSESTRAQWWDYGWNGAYFITICTKKRRHYFGEIKDKKMILSHVGVIAHILWHEIPNHAQFAELGEFVVMPNHIHGILIINKPKDIEGSIDADTDTQNESDTHSSCDIISSFYPIPCIDYIPDKDTMRGEDTNHTGHILNQEKTPEQDPKLPSIQQTPIHKAPPTTIGQTRFQNIGKHTVSSILGSYKSAVTKYANRLGYENGWQVLFHDHIIRNEAAYQRISNYIKNNPANWKEDTFY